MANANGVLFYSTPFSVLRNQVGGICAGLISYYGGRHLRWPHLESLEAETPTWLFAPTAVARHIYVQGSKELGHNVVLHILNALGFDVVAQHRRHNVHVRQLS